MVETASRSSAPYRSAFFHQDYALSFPRSSNGGIASCHAAAEYEDAFGPLTAREVDTRSGHWTWIDDPWPWEGAED